MRLATAACSAACCWPSTRMASSIVSPRCDSIASSCRCSVEAIVAERARAPQEPGDERRVHLVRPAAGAVRHRLDGRRQAIGGDAMRARLGQHVAALAQVVDQRQLQHAGPGPELADGQRRDRLEGGDEALQALRVEPARARADELERQRVDARQARRTRPRRRAAAGGRTRPAGRGGCRAPRPRRRGSCRAAIRPPATRPPAARRRRAAA